MKTLRLIGMAILAVIMSVSFAACGSDDGETYDSPYGNNGDSSSENNGTYTTDDGDKILLSSITRGSSKLSFTYDSEGRPTYANCWNEYGMNFSYDPYKVTFVDDDEQSLGLSFNSEGYVTQLVWDQDWTGGYTSDVYSTNMSFSYDSSGHLTKASGTEKEVYEDEDGSSSYSSSYSVTLTWSKGNLTKIKINEDGVLDGEKYSSTETYDNFEYDEVNEYKQPLMVFSDIYSDFSDYACDLMFIGYFGIGTENLPTSYEHSYDDDDPSTRTVSYTTNSDGTVKTEKIDSTTYTYAYSTLSTRSAAPSEQVYNSSEETQRHINPLKHHHGHHVHE